MPGRVSVIIPTFNRSRMLCQAIESVCNQEGPEIEIIVVDDGSDEPTEIEIRRYGDRVRFFRQDHGGLNRARNLGLQKAQGEFIALLDDDDLWLPFKTDVQTAVLNRFPDVAYVFSDFIIFDENGNRTPQGLSTWNNFPKSWNHDLESKLSAKELGLPLPEGIADYSIYHGRLYHDLLYDPYILPATALVRRSAIQRDSPFPENNILCGDWQFFAELSRSAPCVYLSLTTALNRSHGDAVRLTRKSPLERNLDRLKLIEDVWRKDEIFLAGQAFEVNRVEAEQLLKLGLLCVYENRRQQAKGYLRRWIELNRFKPNLRGYLICILAYLPFSPWFIFALRRLREELRNTSLFIKSCG